MSPLALRRVPFMKPLYGAGCALFVILVLVFAVPRDAAATIALSPRACEAYATWSGNLVWARHLGADKEKARQELIASDKKMPSTIFALLLSRLDELWITTANWEQVILLVLQDCIFRQGVYDSRAAGEI